jgi:hypothetical protein
MHDIINSKELIKAALGGYDFLVVFGASNKGREGLSILTRLDMEVRFFCDNDANKWGTVFCERGVISPDDLIALGKDVPVLIASMYEAEIREQMCRLGLVNIVNDKLGKLLERKRLECFPTLEITTVIGCKVNCRFCPQQKLITEYARTSDKRILSFDDYKTCIDKVPANMRIDFSGMAEPFLNDNCGKMMLYAHEKGHDMVVYSTLVNMKYDDLESIRGIPFKQFVIHLPDEERYETNQSLRIISCY